MYIPAENDGYLYIYIYIYICAGLVSAPTPAAQGHKIHKKTQIIICMTKTASVVELRNATDAELMFCQIDEV